MVLVFTSAGALRLVESVQVSNVVELADPFSIEIHPREADVFIGYSTTHGQISPIHKTEGTDFFQVHCSDVRISARLATGVPLMMVVHRGSQVLTNTPSAEEKNSRPI